MTSQYRNENFLHQMESDMTVQALPDESVDGEPAKVYAYSLTKPVKSDAKTWVSQKSGMPIQIESTGSYRGRTSTTRVHYSSFDDPSIRIDAPN
jgi:outer membrane lipoprotein-sorting protein